MNYYISALKLEKSAVTNKTCAYNCQLGASKANIATSLKFHFFEILEHYDICHLPSKKGLI